MASQSTSRSGSDADEMIEDVRAQLVAHIKRVERYEKDVRTLTKVKSVLLNEGDWVALRDTHEERIKLDNIVAARTAAVNELRTKLNTKLNEDAPIVDDGSIEILYNDSAIPERLIHQAMALLQRPFGNLASIRAISPGVKAALLNDEIRIL
jgi:hypothetical protein